MSRGAWNRTLRTDQQTALHKYGNAYRQCYRLLFNLRRQPAYYALYHEGRWPRADMVQFPIRG